MTGWIYLGIVIWFVCGLVGWFLLSRKGYCGWIENGILYWVPTFASLLLGPILIAISFFLPRKSS